MKYELQTLFVTDLILTSMHLSVKPILEVIGTYPLFSLWTKQIK